MKTESKTEEGIRTSSEHSGESWKDRATLFVYAYLLHNKTLFCDDLWKAGLEVPVSPRALGAVIRAAQSKGWIREQRHGWDVMARPSEASNGQLKRVWKSKIYNQK